MKKLKEHKKIIFFLKFNNIMHMFLFLEEKEKEHMKVYVAAPGQHNWPNIPDDIQDRILSILNEYLNDNKFDISLKRSRKKIQIKHPIKQHLAIGLRCVMRCLKQKQ